MLIIAVASSLVREQFALTILVRREKTREEYHDNWKSVSVLTE